MREHDDDRLWQGELPPDLERLRAWASALPLPAEPRWDAAPVAGPHPARRALAWLPWAAGLVAMLGIGLMARDAWRVQALSGHPALSGVAFADRLGKGGALVTDATSRARVEVPGVGAVFLEPGGRLVRMGGGGPSKPRVRLERGTLHAEVDAARQLVIGTSAGSAVNLGGACTIAVNDSGKGRLEVTRGRVKLESAGREDLLPAGLWCPLAGTGAGVPRRTAASPAFLAAVAVTDNPACQADDFTPLLAQAEASDAVTLWHLLPRVRGKVRRQVAERIAALIEVPRRVPIERVLALEPAALEAWWDALGVGRFEDFR
jgi:hypothetical protein